MAFHSHSHAHAALPSSSQQNAQQASHGVASGLLQAANLGSIGAPAGNLTNAISGRAAGTSTTSTPAGTDRLYPSSGDMSSSTSGGQSAPPSSYGLQQPGSSTTSPAGAAMNQQFETPRRARHPDELHLGSNATNMTAPLSPRDYTPAGPRISLEQVTPGSSGNQYQSGGQLPGSLQAGRPGPMSANTAPGAVPTTSQISSQDQYSLPSRSSAMGSSHNYTRSSPAGFDGQGYPSFGATTPGGSEQYTSPAAQKYTPQTAQRKVSNTPLGLADIRPRADSSLADGMNPYSYDGANVVPTNSNYLAPWAIYAFDWCKWPAQNSDGGKVAVGSYLEDGHNFVSYQMIYPAPQ